MKWQKAIEIDGTSGHVDQSALMDAKKLVAIGSPGL